MRRAIFGKLVEERRVNDMKNMVVLNQEGILFKTTCRHFRHCVHSVATKILKVKTC